MKTYMLIISKFMVKMFMKCKHIRKENLMGIKIKEMRKQFGFTQKEIAKIIGITKSAYSLKENGHRKLVKNKGE